MCLVILAATDSSSILMRYFSMGFCGNCFAANVKVTGSDTE